MSLASRNLFTQLNCALNSPKLHFQNRKFSISSSPKPCLNPLNFHTAKSHFLNFVKVTSHSHHWSILVKPLEQDGMVGRGSYSGNEFNFDAFLSILEFLSLASSAVISVIFAVNSALSGSQRSVFGWFGNRILVWQCLSLVVGVVVGAVIRRGQWRRICSADFSRPVNLVERIEKLEEDLKSSATIIRVLSRQLEKLGIRFRVTRKALKEPIAEAAALAQKNSEATRALAVQEDILEKELGEIQKVLLAMQMERITLFHISRSSSRNSFNSFLQLEKVENCGKTNENRITKRMLLMLLIHQLIESHSQVQVKFKHWPVRKKPVLIEKMVMENIETAMPIRFIDENRILDPVF